MQWQLRLWEEPHAMEDKKESRSPLIPLQTHKASEATLGKGSSLAGTALPSSQSPLPWAFNTLATWEPGNYTYLCKDREKKTDIFLMVHCPSSPPSSIFPIQASSLHPPLSYTSY